ncbi:MAG: ABC transporter permease [Beijerinckiaceae bacterium]
MSDVTGLSENNAWQRIAASQAFWVALALIAICIVMTILQPRAFASTENFYNITRNFAFVGIMALGMTVVIITGGIDLSVGSVMGLVAIIAGLVLQAGYSWPLAFAAGAATGLACGLVNGGLIAYVGLSPFVVTLGMLSIARSLAIVFSENKMIYDFGPDAKIVYEIGGGQMFGVANPVWLLLLLTLITGWVLNFTAWGRYIFAIGGNESAARLTGVPVNRVKMQAYIVSALCAAIASLMILGWQGSAINALGQGYELRVIAATVIGGANLMGGAGTAFGAFIGSALIEVIRNGLLMAGVDANWQGAFVGAFIVMAVVLERVRGRRRD